ncbi:MAG: hypothetical protein U1F25_11170 [Rubrivivax sp.]
MRAWQRGARARALRLRQGQLDLSCAQCHDQHAGRRLAGSVIPQGHPTGYPIYRLECRPGVAGSGARAAASPACAPSRCLPTATNSPRSGRPPPRPKGLPTSPLRGFSPT